MSITVPLPGLVDIRQPIVGDSFGWAGLEPTAAKKSDQANAVMLVQRMVSSVARQAKSNKVFRVVVGRYGLLEATLNSRMIYMVNDEIIGATTYLTLKFITLKDSLFIAVKTVLLPRFILSGLKQFRRRNASSFVFISPKFLKFLRFKFQTPLLYGFASVLLKNNRLAIGTGKLAGRTKFEWLSATATKFVFILLHAFRLSFHGGLR